MHPADDSPERTPPRVKLCAYEKELDKLLRGSDPRDLPQETVWYDDRPIFGCYRTGATSDG